MYGKEGNMRKGLLLGMIVLGLFLATACSDRPTAAQIREDANGYSIRSAADQAALNSEQQRQFNEQEQAKKMAVQQWWLDVRNASKHVAIVMVKVDIVFLGVALASILVSSVIGFSQATIGTGKAIAKAADFRADWMPMDVKTRQYPALRFVRGDIFMLANPNDDSVMRLDVNQPADRQKVIAAGMTQFGGLLAYETARAKTDSGAENIPLINPGQAILADNFDVATYEQVRKLFGVAQEVDDAEI